MDTNDQQPTATSYLQRTMLAAMQQYEREFAAANNSPTGATLLTLAHGYHRATTDARREDLAAEVVETLTLAEAGTIRRAAKALELGMPGIICRARAAGMAPNEIARQLGATGSYVRRILRENIDLLIAETKAHNAQDNDDTSGHDWHHPTPSAGLVCRRCNLAHKNWSGDDCPATA